MNVCKHVIVIIIAWDNNILWSYGKHRETSSLSSSDFLITTHSKSLDHVKQILNTSAILIPNVDRLHLLSVLSSVLQQRCRNFNKMLLELVGTFLISVKTRQLQVTTFDDSPFYYGCFRKSLFYAYFQIDIAHSGINKHLFFIGIRFLLLKSNF